MSNHRRVLPVVAPEYLKSYTKQIRTLSKKTASYRPTEFPDCTRTYIFDCRLRTLFAMLDVTKLTTSVMYSYGQEAFEPSDYVFGDAPPPCGIIDEGESLELFVKDFQFIPNDFFAFNHLAFFYQDRFISMTHLSTYQTAILFGSLQKTEFSRLLKGWLNGRFNNIVIGFRSDQIGNDCFATFFMVSSAFFFHFVTRINAQ